MNWNTIEQSGALFLSTVLEKNRELVLAETLLRDLSLLKILEIMVEEREITPQIKLEHGIEYPKMKKFPEWQEKIRKLIELGLVEEKIADRVIECPYCGKIHVSARFKCPSCGSINMIKTEIIQHVTCGFVDTKLKFLRQPKKESEEQLVCPNCKVILREEGVDYRVLGEIFECIDCGRRADRPKIHFICRECGKEFSILTAKYRAVYMYRTTDYGIKLLKSGDLIRNLILLSLLSKGFQVEKNATLKGISGVSHRFDIVVKADQSLIGVDYRPIASAELQITDLLAHIAKFMDFPDIKYIYVTDSSSESIRKVASSQGVNLVSGKSITEILNQILALVKKFKERKEIKA